MSDLRITGPRPEGEDSEPSSRQEGPNAGGPQAQRGQPRAKPHIASPEECLAALSKIPALVAMGMLTTAQANTCRAIYVSLLQHHQKQQAGTGRQPIDQRSLGQILRAHPELASHLAPLLTDAEIALLMAQALEGSDGPA